ncbi:conserved hypothetical protein [Culex quinquefasciatus]|uniref:BHLH domain-containing protein n=1 Tax=Culex quinquefasciatus TaxID=7176 RepID=B0XHB3_CULQU|nr:conserved hypothetical protein [Culex quinquefasciatus]|eukprot:XP_001869035.1 conserved hypothetical protein [Culex quinquefasciatus]
MASSTTITVRNISSLNPLKRIKFKENQVIIPIGNGNFSDDEFDDLENGPVLKRKIPLGTLGSIENVMFGEGQRKPLGQLQIGSPAPASGGPGRRKNADAKSAITAVERRNARERNRVQQVNNGFAALRQRIPEEIAEAFESGNTRGVHKKLSKVETLRMAVEYIKCLEQMLTLDPEKEGSSLKFTPQLQQPQESLLSSNPTTGTSSVQQLLPCNQTTCHRKLHRSTQITIINGHQYIRIPGTNTFQYLDPESLYDESQNDSSFFADGSSVIDAQDAILEDSSDLASECAIALSPQSNFTLEPPEVATPEASKYVSMIQQQQYADIMMIKSELEEDVNEQQELLQQTANDPSFLESMNWFESHQQLPVD